MVEQIRKHIAAVDGEFPLFFGASVCPAKRRVRPLKEVAVPLADDPAVIPVEEHRQHLMDNYLKVHETADRPRYAISGAAVGL